MRTDGVSERQTSSTAIGTAAALIAAGDRRNARQIAGLSRTVRAGFAHHQAGRLDRAEQLYRKALGKDPDHPDALHLLGVIAYQSEQIGWAIQLIERALPALTGLPDAYLNYGNALQKAGRLAEAVDSYRRAVALNPDYGMAHSNLARALNDQGLFEAGLESARRAVERIPDFLGAHVNCAAALVSLGHFAEAEAPLRRALDLMPDRAETHRDLGRVLARLGRLDAAEAAYRHALALSPDYADAHNNLGAVLLQQHRRNEAVTCYRRAAQLKPNVAMVHYNLGVALTLQGRLSEAIASFRRAMTLNPDDAAALAAWFYQRKRVSDWSGYPEDEARVRNAVRAQPSIEGAAILLRLSSTPEEQFDCTRQAIAQITVPQSAMLPGSLPRPDQRIRLGYLSSDFREHAVAHLIAGLIERHDRRRFEVIGYSHRPDDGSTMRARLTGAFDRFLDLGNVPHRQAAELIHADAVDILIDLNGFTRDARTAILAYRPAPIQVNYLGYPGTMGADFIDYIIVDPFVVPLDQGRFFSERLVHLPECYQCNDDKRAIADHTLSRFECGLPERGFVFCCFNNSFKITPTFFDIWMRLLRAVPRSVLWLMDTNPWAKANLAHEAAARGIAFERLVFAPRLAVPEHLARHRLADLFLDTLPYGAHTTASDALWAGLPLLTCAGNTFAGRVAGSLLRTLGLGELVTTSLEEYEALALLLAREPEMLSRLRTRLAENRRTRPLFDTARFTRNIEAAYRRMWEIWRAGRPPAAFLVSPWAGA